jgi:hypothetical protein
MYLLYCIKRNKCKKSGIQPPNLKKKFAALRLFVVTMPIQKAVASGKGIMSITEEGQVQI